MDDYLEMFLLLAGAFWACVVGVASILLYEFFVRAWVLSAWQWVAS